MSQLGRISGPLLRENLLRNGTDLRFETDLLYLSVVDSDDPTKKVGIGVKTSSPQYELDVNGTVRSTNLLSGYLKVDDVEINSNQINSYAGNLVIKASTLSNRVEIFDPTITGNLLPDATLTRDIGSPSLQWNTAYVNTIQIGGTLQVTGDLTASNIVISGNTISSTVGPIIIDPYQNELIKFNNSAELTGSLTVSADVAINGGDLTTTDTTFNLLNATATTVNFAGAGTAVNIGAATGTTNVKNNLDVDGNTVLNGTLIVDLNTTVTGDLAVNGGDLTTDQITFNLLNAAATTVNFAGAATVIEIGSATGITNINNNLDVDGDVNIDGGDLTVSTTTFNLANTTATTVNFAGAATVIEIGSATGITNINNNLDVDGDVNIDGGDLTVSTTTFNLANTTATTGNLFGDATTINIGAAGSVGTLTVKNDSVVLDGDLQVKGGDLTTDQITFNLINTTATTVNFAGAATIVEIGAATGTTNINNNLDVDGDVNIDGGDLTVSTATFNLANTTATTGNLFGDATAINLGNSTAATLTIRPGTVVGTNTTQDLWNTTATTVNFAGAGIAVNIGAATGTTNVKNNLDVDGDVNIDGGDLTVSTATFNLANTTATTVNFAGSATTIEIGAATGTTNINNDLDVDGDVNIDGGDLTASTSTFNLLNTTINTVNAFGAATVINVGANTSTVTLNHDLTVNNNVLIKGNYLSTDQTSFYLLDSAATTVSAFGAAEVLVFASSTGTTTFRSDVVINNDLQVKGGDITTNSSTFNLINDTATTVNFAGNATVLNIGPVGGTSTFNGDVQVNGTLNVNGQSTLASVNVEDLTNGRVLLAGTNGELEDSSNLTFNGTKLTVTGDAEITGDVTIGGNLTLGNQNLDTITVVADFTSNLLPDVSSTYTLGSASNTWASIYADTAIVTELSNGVIKLSSNIVEILTVDTNLVLQPNGTGRVVLNTTTAVTIPVGTEAERPTLAIVGDVRFNTNTARVENYNGEQWNTMTNEDDAIAFAIALG